LRQYGVRVQQLDRFARGAGSNVCIVADLLCAREGMSDADGTGEEADELDKLLLSVSVPRNLLPHLVQRLGIVLAGFCGDEDVRGATKALIEIANANPAAAQAVVSLSGIEA
jgi:hypothetical protein